MTEFNFHFTVCTLSATVLLYVNTLPCKMQMLQTVA